MENLRMQHQNSIKDNILKLSVSYFKNLPRISGAIHDLVNDTLRHQKQYAEILPCIHLTFCHEILVSSRKEATK